MGREMAKDGKDWQPTNMGDFTRELSDGEVAKKLIFIKAKIVISALLPLRMSSSIA